MEDMTPKDDTQKSDAISEGTNQSADDQSSSEQCCYTVDPCGCYRDPCCVPTSCCCC